MECGLSPIIGFRLARGFTGERRSSYFHVITIGKVDLALVSLFLVVLGLSCTNMWWLRL